ncbi:MAG: glycosyltransferase family 4 protein [Pyrinomonadaceae bacterium]
MRVLYFYQYFTTPKGAWSTRAYEFTRRWVKAGDSVTVVTSVYDKSDLKADGLVARLRIEGIDVRVINLHLSNKHGVAYRVWTFVAYALLASWYALRLPADVVVASSGPITVGLPGLVARYLRGRPLVFEVRDLWPEGSIQLGLLRNRLMIRLTRWFEQLCYHAATTVVVLSDGMADWIRGRYGLDKLVVIPNASDNELAERANGSHRAPEWAAGKQLILYTGTLGLIDDCGQILEVARVIEQSGARDLEIVLIGDGKERAMLEQRGREMNLSHVHFLGLMSKEDVASWLQTACCSLFVVKDVPFLATASPNKLFDAFASGVPVVQATQGWIKDLLTRERCGITVPPNNPQAMADAVLRVAGEKRLREDLGANARRVAHELFDRDLLATRMRQALLEAAGR